VQNHSTTADLDASEERRESFIGWLQTETASIEKSYSQGQIAPEIEVSPITVSDWWTGHSLMAQRESIQRLKKFLSVH
jgi:hypothetical protein